MSTWIHLLLFLLPTISALNQWSDLNEKERNQGIVLWLIIVGVSIGISVSIAGGAFFVMSRRNRNQGQMMVVH
ncbi:unnamed protein product [Caenorhabditis nigoni]